MLTNRREFLHRVTGTAAAGFLGSVPAGTTSCAAQHGPAPPRPAAGSRIKAVAFDAFPIFDPRPIAALAEELCPGKGALLSEAWRTRQFEYTWLRVASHEYADFWQVTADALVFAERALALDLGEEKRARLVGAYLDLRAWPDVAAGARGAEGRGDPALVPVELHAEDARGRHRELRSGWPVRARAQHGPGEDVQPDPRAYRMALDAFGLTREEIAFVAFAGWDAAGARWFGYPTFWVNRLGLPAEELGVTADATGASLSDLVGVREGEGVTGGAMPSAPTSRQRA